MYKKILVGLGAMFSLATISFFAVGNPIPLFTNTSACNEPSQLLNCANTIVNTLNGAGSTVPLTVGTRSFATGTTPVVLNAQSGVVEFTGVTAAGNANATAQVMTNSFVTAASGCNATINTTTAAAGSGPAIKSVTPTAGSLSIVITNATATTTGSSTFDIAFQCF